MKIHLIRHAKTAQSVTSGLDFDRKLLPKGIVQANILGYYLKEHKIKPAFTFCSASIRTKETLSIIQNSVELGIVSFPKELYLSERDVYLKKIWELKHGKDLMIVGHNDGISAFATYLTDEPIRMSTCDYLCIEFDSNSWQEVSKGMGKITDQFRPMVFLPL